MSLEEDIKNAKERVNYEADAVIDTLREYAADVNLEFAYVLEQFKQAINKRIAYEEKQN